MPKKKKARHYPTATRRRIKLSKQLRALEKPAPSPSESTLKIQDDFRYEHRHSNIPSSSARERTSDFGESHTRTYVKPEPSYSEKRKFPDFNVDVRPKNADQPVTTAEKPGKKIEVLVSKALTLDRVRYLRELYQKADALDQHKKTILENTNKMRTNVEETKKKCLSRIAQLEDELRFRREEISFFDLELQAINLRDKELIRPILAERDSINESINLMFKTVSMQMVHNGSKYRHIEL
jgi:hypothetical protein